MNQLNPRISLRVTQDLKDAVDKVGAQKVREILSDALLTPVTVQQKEGKALRCPRCGAKLVRSEGYL